MSPITLRRLAQGDRMVPEHTGCLTRTIVPLQDRLTAIAKSGTLQLGALEVNALKVSTCDL